MGIQLVGIFATSFVVGLSGALMPGPLLTLTITQTIKRGFRTAPLVATGHALVELVVVAGLFFGLSQIVQSSVVKGCIEVVGGMVLIWMGYGMGAGAWRRQVKLELTTPQVPAGAPDDPPHPRSVAPELTTSLKPRRGLLGSSLVMGGTWSVANPYWLLWWATFGVAYIGRYLDLGITGAAAFYLGHIASDFGWLILVGVVVVSGRKFMSDRVYRGIVLGCAAVLVGLGISLVADGTPELLRAIA